MGWVELAFFRDISSHEKNPRDVHKVKNPEIEKKYEVFISGSPEFRDLKD